jgi:hypothetical protein
MAQLKTDYANGEILFAGNIGSTSNVNGITCAINNKLKWFNAVTGTTTAGVGSTNEMSVISCMIAANTVSSGILVMATAFYTDTSVPSNTTFKLKIGAFGSETTRMTETTSLQEAANVMEHVPILWFEKNQTWTNPINVTITSQHSATSGSANVRQLIICGY